MKQKPNQQNLQSVLNILYTLQEIDPEFPIQYAICISEIALNEGLSITALAEKTNIALSTVSRIANILSANHNKRRDLNLIDIKISPQERRKKQLFLTPSGRAITQNLSLAITGAQ